jgi:signal transduction histidine kinase
MDEVVGPVNDEQKDVLATVKNNVDRLSRLINDVLDYQKLESGRMKFTLTAQEIDAIIQGVVSQFRPEAEKKGLRLASRVSEQSLKVLCDRDKITQVLYNLLGNAVKFTDHGAVAVSVERFNGRCVKVSVKDDGVGIRGEDRHKLFQSFSQLAPVGDRKTGGTGLGLSISKKIIEGHHGEIGVESEYGHGATFYFTLPLAA